MYDALTNLSLDGAPHATVSVMPQFNLEQHRWIMEYAARLPTARSWGWYYRPDRELDASLSELWQREYDPSIEASAQ